MFSSKWFYVVVVVFLILIIVIYKFWTPPPSVALQIEVTGGFAYVAPPAGDNHLEIAYLNDWLYEEDLDGDGKKEELCNVPQVGTELKLTWGTIVSWEPSTMALPPSREFDLDKAVIKFPALETANLPLKIGRGGNWPPSPTTPSNPDDETNWKDMVPALRSHHNGTAINPNWRTMVNGRLVLPGGQIRAALPSNPRFKHAQFEFKANSAVKFKAAMTDKTIYNVRVPGNTIEIQLSGATSGLTKLVIAPQSNRVEFTLKGKHAMGSPIPGPGAPLKDFCTFYQLLQPMPAGKEFLVPHYIPPASGPGSGGSPSPGFFCNGDWF